MAYTVILHIANEDAVVGEVEELPSPGDNLIIVQNPRRRDGKDLIYLEANVTTVIWPMHRMNFIEVLPGEEEEQIIGFVRE
jgi:hypothetical protein